jgi:hypothetical protein
MRRSPVGTTNGTVAFVDGGARAGFADGRCHSRLSASWSSFAGFRFPPDVIMAVVRWYLPAPRGASLYPHRSWEELEARFLGLMAYLDPKR